MIRGVAKIRAAIALVLLSVPYLLLVCRRFDLAFPELMLLLGWAGFSLACTAAGWYLLRGLWHKAQPPQVQPDLSWPPQGMEVWKQVEQLAAEIEGEELPLDRPEKLVAVVRRVADVVARHYHPDAADPWLETPFPHVLRIVELVARDLRQATLGYVPGSHILTIGDLRRLQKLAGMAHRSYFWYRIASFVINTPAAFLREARDAVFGQLKDMSTETARRWAIGYFVRRTGYYAIQLYGGQLVLDDAQPADAPLQAIQAGRRRRSAADRRARQGAAADPCRGAEEVRQIEPHQRLVRRVSRRNRRRAADRPGRALRAGARGPATGHRPGHGGLRRRRPRGDAAAVDRSSARLRHGRLRLLGRFRRAGGRPPFPQRTAGRIPAEPGPPSCRW